MLKTVYVTACLCLLPLSAMADPVGLYDVKGTNVDTGEEYTGAVEVTRTGSTYALAWKIGDLEFYGTGIGMHLEGSNLIVGPATENEIGISVTYSLENTPTLGLYLQQPDGTLNGVWTEAGSQKTSPESWTRVR